MRAVVTGKGFQFDVGPAAWGDQEVDLSMDIDGEPFTYSTCMTPAEARDLAVALRLVADAVEKSRGGK